jgi:O-acetylserine/cysteine efflux transporter
VAALSLTTPLFGVLAAALLLGEPLTWTLAASSVLVTGGIALASLRGEAGRVAGTPAAPRVASEPAP